MEVIADNNPLLAKLQGIRIDSTTKMGSILDLVVVVVDCNRKDARNVLNRVDQKLLTNCQELRIEGKGRATPVADAKTLIEIVWALGGKKAKQFRVQCAEYICRVLGGDPSLVREMEIRAEHTPVEQREFFMQNVPVPSIERLEEEEQRIVARRRIDLEFKEIEARIKEQESRTKKMELDTMEHALEWFLEDADERDKVMAKDLKKRFLSEIYAPSPLLLTSGDHESKRQRIEISIPMVAQRNGLRYTPQDAGSIGKTIRRLYEARYHKEPVKRQVIFQGKPIMENAYWSEDEDLLLAAIVRYASNATDEQKDESDELIADLCEQLCTV